MTVPRNSMLVVALVAKLSFLLSQASLWTNFLLSLHMCEVQPLSRHDLVPGGVPSIFNEHCWFIVMRKPISSILADFSEDFTFTSQFTALCPSCLHLWHLNGKDFPVCFFFRFLPLLEIFPIMATTSATRQHGFPIFTLL